ncbi:hypothetical protein KAR48_19690 [bacterium]|nr:hypothetical protein [bacterium]
MRFEQAKDIIRHAVEMHKMIENHFTSLSARSEDTRLKMISDYLVKREVYLQAGLKEFEEFADKTFDDTWFKFSVCDAKFKKLHEYMETMEVGIEDIVDVTVQLYRCIADQFTTLAMEAEIDEVRDVFQNIADMEKGEIKKMVRNIQMMNEL